MRRVGLKIWAEKHSKYGKDIYKVGSGRELLEAVGWIVAYKPRRYSGYVGMRPPEGGGHRGRFACVEVDLPEEHEIRALADKLHVAGEAYKGTEFGCTVEYEPTKPYKYRVFTTSSMTCEPITEVHEGVKSARFTASLGESTWYASVHWRDENLEPADAPVYYERACNGFGATNGKAARQ